MYRFPELPFSTLEGLIHRMIESQEVVATRHIVSDLAKQDLLESMLEDFSKPSPAHFPAHRHYLLSTPFRYPPLKYGSRFGTRTQPSLFYGAKQRETVLAESAYYRFVFWQDMCEPPKSAIEAQHTMFCVGYCSTRGVDLTDESLASVQPALMHPSDYGYSQAMGAHLRRLEATCIWYYSARDPEGGTNIGIFEPEVLVDDVPRSTSSWSSRTQADDVEFYSIRAREQYRFSREQFCVEPGNLPRPAS